jgi:hypothetical protein
VPPPLRQRNIAAECAIARRSGLQDNLAGGASRLEIAVGVGGGGEGIASPDVGFENAVTQRGEHVARHCVQVIRGVVKEHRLGERSRLLAQVQRVQGASRSGMLLTMDIEIKRCFV